YLKTLLINFHPINIIVILALPVIAAMMVFRYSHSPGGTTVVHALPVTKGTLFFSNWVSGLILALSPIVLNALCLLPFLRPSFAHFGVSLVDMNDFFSSDQAADPNFGDLLLWFISSAVIILFIFSIATLAGVVTGNSTLHLLIAVLLNVIAPAVCLLFSAYEEEFLYGFSALGSPDTAALLHPFSHAMNSGGLSLASPIEVLNIVIYILAALAVSAGAFFLYRAAKTERAGESMTFRSATYVVAFLVTFVGMSAGGFLFYGMTYEATSDPAIVNLYVGALVGSIITLIIAMMVLRKTPKVFDLHTLKVFGCYAVVGVLFLAFTTTDITGFEKRTPDPAQIEAATVTIGNANLFPYMWNNALAIGVSDQAGKETIVALHQDIVNIPEEYRDTNLPDDSVYDASSPAFDPYASLLPSTSHVGFSYDLRNRSGMQREYTLRDLFFSAGSSEVERFVESDLYKRSLSVAGIVGYENLMSIRPAFLPNGYDPIASGISGYEAAADFAKCLDADFAELGYEALTANNRVRLTFNIEYRVPKNERRRFPPRANEENERYNENTLIYAITDDYARSIKWLKDKGYYEDMVAETTESEEQWKEMVKEARG
ncbi:MAG: hypothetical protein LBL63_07425, partial [Clostridiales Family XIII bacterium]|nr:hypothetical protein [Clostridiales Family XIII bacterium]